MELEQAPVGRESGNDGDDIPLTPDTSDRVPPLEPASPTV